MLLVANDPAVPKKDDKAIMGKFCSSPAFSCLTEEKTINAVMVCAEKMTKGGRLAGFKVLEGISRLAGIGPILGQVIHRQKV